MVARPGNQRTNFNAGELAVELYDRTDVKTWYGGASQIDGLEPVPQGGFRQLPRTRHRAIVGRAMNLFASTALANAAGVTGPQIIATFDLGAAHEVAAVDLINFRCSVALKLALAFDVSNNPAAIGTPLVGALDVATTNRTRRIGAPPGSPVTGRYVHVRCAINTGGPVTFVLGSINVYNEAQGIKGRLKSFSSDRTRPYTVVFGPRHADIFKSGAFVGCCFIPHTADQVATLSTTQRFDTMLVWHIDVIPTRILRVNGDSDWFSGPTDLINMPQVDLGGTYGNAVTEVWNVYIVFPDGAQAGNTLTAVLNIDGTETPPFLIPSGIVGLSLNMENAINALPFIGTAGVSVPAYFDDSGTVDGARFILQINFDGGNINGQSFSVTGRFASDARGAITTARAQVGVKAGELIMSASAGYPCCGTFYGDRLFLGGFRSIGSAYLASGPGEYFNMDTRIEAASGPILDNLDTDGSERILQFINSKQLVAFTDASNRFLTNRAVSRTDTRNWAYSSNDGTAPGIPVIESESSLLFINSNRSMVMAATYSDVSQGYDSQPVSLLASHLVSAINDMALQRSQDENDSQRVFMPRDDGLLVIGLLIRNQDVNAYVRWSTDGKVRSVSVDAANGVNLAVERVIDGSPRLCFETFEAGLLFDQALTVNQAASATVPGLDVLEGATVWADVDGFIEGPFTVTDGAITVSQPAAAITVGRWTPPVFADLPLSKVINNDVVVLKRPCRVHTVRASVLSTTSIAIGANGRAPKDIPLARFGDQADTPTPPYTGQVVASALKGWTQDGIAVITQTRPGKLNLRSYVRESKT